MMNDEMNKQFRLQYHENQVIYEKIRGLQEDVELLSNQLKAMKTVLFFDGENTLEYLSMRDGWIENIIWSLQKHLDIIFDEEGMIKENGDDE